MQSITIPTLIRRSVALLSLCVLVATITATWLAAGNASAAPSLPAIADVPTDRVPAQAPAKAPARAADDDDRRSRGKALRGKLNINTASDVQFQLLPGVGPAKAERIVAYRQKHGKFRRIQDLRRVKGIGQKTLAKLAPHLAVDGDSDLTVE